MIVCQLWNIQSEVQTLHLKVDLQSEAQKPRRVPPGEGHGAALQVFAQYSGMSRA